MRRRFGLFALLALAGCGDGVAGPDAPPATDANLGLVRVRIPGHREAEVFFQNADGSLVLATHSDGEGEANAYMVPGGFVTLVSKDTFNTTLYTWAGVEGGDVLELLRDEPPRAPSVAQISIPPGDPSTFFYRLVSPCGIAPLSGAEVEPLPVVLDRCPTSPVGMLVEAFGDTTGYLFRDAVAIEHDPQIVFAGPYLAPEPLLVHVRQIPPLQIPSVRAVLIGSGYELYLSPELDVLAEIPLYLPLPPGAMLAYQVRAVTPSGFGARAVTAWGPVAHDVTLDFGRPLRDYTSRPHYVATENAIRWTEDTTGRIADGVIVSLPWQHDGTGEGIVWRVIAPRTAEPVVRLPVLPRADLRPGVGDTVFDPNVLTSFAVEGGYASVRETLLGTYDQVATWPVRGNAGIVETETLPP